MMKYTWWIEHDNAIAGQHGFSDGYHMTEDEIKAEIERMKQVGIVVYNYGKMEPA